jgi:sulfotransferase
MDKKYFFLAGLPRSGNTVLSSILNQNPEIYSSPLSSVSQYMWICHECNLNFENSITNPYPNRASNMISKIIKNYYEDVEKPIIFDRDKNWANPFLVNMMEEYLDFKPKILFTTRPILEVLASVIAIFKNDIFRLMNNSDYIQNNKLTENENVCDFLMSEHGMIGKSLPAFYSIDNLNSNNTIHVVKYEDLISYPQKTMESIYNFLEIDVFNHNFTNIKKIDQEYDFRVGNPKNLHKIRRVIGRSEMIVQEYVNPKSIEKYKDCRYF